MTGTEVTFSAGSNCRNEARRDHYNYQRNNYYPRGNYYQYQRARDYRQDRSYQRYYRSNQGRGYNQYQSYDRNSNDSRYRGYDERSTAESALIIAGSSGAGAAIGVCFGRYQGRRGRGDCRWRRRRGLRPTHGQPAVGSSSTFVRPTIFGGLPTFWTPASWGGSFRSLGG